jgi:hypothetical protein
MHLTDSHGMSWRLTLPMGHCRHGFLVRLQPAVFEVIMRRRRKRGYTRRRTHETEQHSGFSGWDFPVGSIESRAAVRAALLQTQRRVQMIFCCPELGPPDLRKSTCSRHLCADGTLIETLFIEGDDNQLSAAQLEEFLAQHPISTEELSATASYGSDEIEA